VIAVGRSAEGALARKIASLTVPRAQSSAPRGGAGDGSPQHSGRKRGRRALGADSDAGSERRKSRRVEEEEEDEDGEDLFDNMEE
jgi:hypothetical protein